MHIQHVRGLLIVGLALCAQHASAFLGPPYLTPSNPKAGDLISVNIYHDECDLVDDGINWPPPVTQEGNEITVLFTGIHEGDPEWCYYGVGTSIYPVGSFPPGTYTLDVERRYMGIGGDWIQETLAIIPFAVSGRPPQQPVQAPTLGVAGLAGLCLALIATALLTVRRKV
jgi:hypothetical protein